MKDQQGIDQEVAMLQQRQGCTIEDQAVRLIHVAPDNTC